MELPIQTKPLFSDIISKSALKQNIYHNTIETLNNFKSIIKQLTEEYVQESSLIGNPQQIVFKTTSLSDFEVGLKFGGDILLFVMHTNIFEIPRDHELIRTNYVKSDKERSYCGIIHIYNFLADSFKYNRQQDLGYLIGRIFINKDNHYFIEGKRELGLIYNDFEANLMNTEKAAQIIEAAIRYTLNFDLLVPPYEAVKMTNVAEMRNAIDGFSLKATGKRLGFRFQEDKD